MKDALGSLFGLAIIAFWILMGIGDLYWLWMSIQIGSFWMFVCGILPFTAVFASPIGAYSLLFGVPDWILNTFG